MEIRLKDTPFLVNATEYEKEILCAMLNVFGDGDVPHANLSTLPDIRADQAEEAIDLALHGRIRPNIKRETLASIASKIKSVVRRKLVLEYDVTWMTDDEIASFRESLWSAAAGADMTSRILNNDVYPIDSEEE